MGSLANNSIALGEVRQEVETRSLDKSPSSSSSSNKNVKDAADKNARKLFSRKKKGRAPSYALRKKLNRLLNEPITTLILAIVSFYLIFIDDIVQASGTAQTTALINGVGTIQVVVFFIFLVELIANIFVFRKEYVISPLIILDLLALISMIPDLLVFLFQVQGLTSLHALGITRAARAARVATRLGRLPKIISLFDKKKGDEERTAALEPSKVGRRLVARLITTVICLMMILLLAAILCTTSPDVTPHARVALSELHSVASHYGINSAEFNTTRDTYISAYADVPVLYLEVMGTIVLNLNEAISLSQPTYLVQFDSRIDGSMSTAILSEQNAIEYSAGLSIALSFVLIILLIGGTLFITRDASIMVIQPLEKMLALIKKMTQTSALATQTTYAGDSDDDSDPGDILEDGDSGFTDNDFDSDTEDAELETEVLVSMLDKLTHEHEEEEQKKKAQEAIVKVLVIIQSGAKGWVARKRFTDKRKLAKRVQLIAAELLSTEKSYVTGLQICVTQFLVPLRASSIIAPEKISIIFSNIEQIWEYNKALLVKLDERISQWAPNQVVGDIFVELSKDILDLYTAFVNNYNDAIECVKNSRASDDKFNKFLEDKITQPECNSLDLQSYLIMPVQRIPRYVMLLDQVLKFTPPDHRDYAKIDEAFKLMKQVTTAMNERKRDAENQFTVQEIVMRMDVPIDILLENKVALLKTNVFKHEGDSYLCYLFTNAFVQTKEKNEGLAVKTVIPLGLLKLINVCDSPQFGLYNAIQLEGSEAPLLLTSKTPEQKKEWTDAINTQLLALKIATKLRAAKPRQMSRDPSTSISSPTKSREISKESSIASIK